MRLLDLEPQFRRYRADGALVKTDSVADAQGITFCCPYPGHGHWILVWFRGRGVPPEAEPKDRWAVSGTGYADLTLSPSVDVTCGGKYPDEWHGHVQGGGIV